MDSVQATTYEIRTGFSLGLALVTDLHSMSYDELLMLLQRTKDLMRFSMRDIPLI